MSPWTSAMAWVGSDPWGLVHESHLTGPSSAAFDTNGVTRTAFISKGEAYGQFHVPHHWAGTFVGDGVTSGSYL